MVVGLVCAPTHGMSIGGGFCQTSGHWHRPLHPARPAWQLRVSARRSRNQRSTSIVMLTLSQEESSDGLLEASRTNGCLLQSFRLFNWRLYGSLLLKAAIPTVYTTTRIYFLGQMPQASGVDIASQLYWVSLLLEVMEEALIYPLYHCIGESIQHDAATRNKVRTGLWITVLSYSIFCLLVETLADPLVDWMAPQREHRADTVKYIRWEMLAAVVQGCDKFFNVVFLQMKRDRVICGLTLLQMLLTIFFDYLFVSQMPCSFRLGTVGLALSNLCTYSLVLLVALPSVPKPTTPLSWTWLPSWWRAGRWVAVSSLVRNLTYVVFVARMVNVLKQPGNYWLANNFIWKWLLLLFVPLTDLLKQEVSCRPRVRSAHLLILPAYLLLSAVISVLWLLTSCTWRSFFLVILNVKAPDMALEIVSSLLPFYLCYLFAALLDSIFYGFGLTDQVAIASVIANLGVYGSAFCLYKAGVLTLSLGGIMHLFGAGIVVGCIVRLLLYLKHFFGASGR